MNSYNVTTTFFTSLLLFLFQRGHANQILFKRQYGTTDALNIATNHLYDAHLPIQQAPIYGHECINEDCSKRRFFTVRFGNDPVVKFSNYWTIFEGYAPNKFPFKCPKNMPVLRASCYRGNCLRLRLNCGYVPFAFGQMTSHFKFVMPSNSSKLATCTDSMYVSGLECPNGRCIPTGLHCTTLEMYHKPKSKYSLDVSGNRQIERKLLSSMDSGPSEKMNRPIFKWICHGTLCDSVTLFSIDRGMTPLLGPVEK